MTIVPSADLRSGNISISKDTSDVLKIFAALLVITSHMASVSIGSFGASYWIFYAVASQNGYLGVALFFFLSGYGLMESEQHSHLSLTQFLRKRIAKVYLPVILVTALWLGIQHISNLCGYKILEDSAAPHLRGG